MTCKILSEDRWQRFLENKLAREESRAISMHLLEDCPDCEEFFMNLSPAEEQALRCVYSDLLRNEEKHEEEGVLLRSAASGYPSDGATLALEDKPAVWWGRWFGAPLGLRENFAWAGGVLALLIMTVGVLPSLHIDQIPAQREKGLAAAGLIEVGFMIGERRHDGELAVVRGRNGGSYRSDSLLFLRFETASRGYVYVVESQEGRPLEVLYAHGQSADPLAAGEHQVRDGSDLLAFTLDGQAGRRMIIGVFSPAPLDVSLQWLSSLGQAIDSSAGTIDKKAINSLGNGVTVDTVYFDIGA